MTIFNTEQAFTRFWKDNYKKAVYFTGKLTEHFEEAEDIVSNSFIKIWEHRNRFNSLDKAGSSLITYCRNEAFGLWKHKKRKNKSHQQILWLSNEEIKEKEFTADIMQAVLKELEFMPYDRREIFMKWVNQEEYSEIAEKSNISVDTGRVQVKKAIDYLREVIINGRTELRYRPNTIFVHFKGKTKSLAEWCKELDINFGTAKERVKEGLKASQVLSKKKSIELSPKEDDGLYKTKWYKMFGKPLKEKCKEAGISRLTFYQRLRKGLTIEEALSTAKYST